MPRYGALLAITLGALLAFEGGAAGNGVSIPKAGSEERRLVIEAARQPIEADVGEKITLPARILRVSSEWALVVGTPARAAGGAIDWSKTIYADAVKKGEFTGEAAVLLARDGKGWRVVTYSVGYGKSIWETWDEEFGAPAWLWP